MAPSIGTGVWIGSGVLISSATAPPWWIAGTPLAAYVVGAAEYTDVPEWGDDSGSGLVLTSASGADPTFSLTAKNGSPGILFASGDELYGESAADWTTLHSGQSTLFFDIHNTNANNFQWLGYTTVNTTGNGMRVQFNGGVNSAIYTEYNAGVVVVNAQSAGGTVPDTCILAVRCDLAGGSPHCEIWVDGAVVKTADYTGTPSLLAPTRSFGLGKAQGINNHFTGALGAALAYDYALTDEEMAAVFAALATASSQRTVRIVRQIGDSKTATAARAGRKLAMRTVRTSNRRVQYCGSQTPSGTHPFGDKRHDGVSGETIVQITARIAGYSGDEPTDTVTMAGANSYASRGLSGSLDDMALLIDALLARHPAARHWILADSYGFGTGNNTLVGIAGSFNAALPALCSSKGVNFVDIHAGPYAYDVATHTIPADTVGHWLTEGGEAIGNTLADAMGYP